MAPKLRPFEPWAPPDLTLTEVSALKAVAQGIASEYQQRLAMTTVVEKICRRYELPFCPGEDGRRNTDFALGRMSAGTTITSFVNADINEFRDDKSPREQG